MVHSFKDKIIQYILIALISGFFFIPILALCWTECKTFAAKRIASVLVLFFR